jgi:hypothetical protein
LSYRCWQICQICAGFGWGLQINDFTVVSGLISMRCATTYKEFGENFDKRKNKLWSLSNWCILILLFIFTVS